jgi:hypothetical protein
MGTSAKSMRWLRIFPPGVWIIIAVCAILGGRLFGVHAWQPAHREEIMKAYASISPFYGSPQLNHAGNQVVYVSDGKTARSLYLCDIDSGRKQVVSAGIGEGAWENNYHLDAWPWSPDDRYFAYFSYDSLFVYQVESNLISAQLTIGTNANVSGLIWLSPQQFAWQQGNSIYYAKYVDGHWEKREMPFHGLISSLTAIDDNTIAWLQDGYICHFNLAQDIAGTNNSFVQPVISNQTAPHSADLVLWLDASTLQQSNQTPVTELTDLSRKLNQTQTIVDNNPPTYNGPESPRALNGKGTIHFLSDASSGSGLRTIRSLGVAGSSPRSVFAVMRRDSGHQMLVNMGQAGEQGRYFGICDWESSLYLPSNWHIDNIVNPVPANWNIFEVVYDGDNLEGYVNGQLKGAKSLTLDTADEKVEIGLRTGNNPVSSDGDFAELLVYNRALDSNERQQVEDYLSLKWFGLARLSPQNPLIWFNPSLSGISDFSYSRKDRCFLISSIESGQDSLWRLDTPEGATAGPTKILESESILNAQWCGSGGFAFATRQSGQMELVLADLLDQQEEHLFEDTNSSMDSFVAQPDSGKLLVLGMVTNELVPEIWLYDIAKEKFNLAVSCSDFSSPFAHHPVVPENKKISLPSGRSADCLIFRPANYSRYKRYPLIICDTAYDPYGLSWDWIQGLVNCGAYVATAKRSGWGDMGHAQENIFALYDYLVRNERIDTQRVYFYSNSGESEGFGNALLTQFPAMWKGAILNSPTELPDFFKVPRFERRPQILITAGGEEHWEDQLKQYQLKALNDGVVVEYFVYPGDPHVVVGNANFITRATDIMHFVLEE